MNSLFEEIALNEVCEIGNGYAFKSTQFKENGVPLLRISNIDNERVSFEKGAVYLDEDYLSKYESFIVKNGDVVIALSGATTGKYGTYQLSHPCLLNQRIGIIRNGKSDRLDSKYFHYYLYELKAEILRQAQGAAQPNISTKDIGRLEIPLPPLDEQKKIAAILDAADALRQKDVQLIAKYNTLSQSLFLDMFGDLPEELVSLSSLCEINPKKSEIVRIPKSTQVSFISMSHVSEEGEVDLSEIRTLAEVWTGFTYFAEDDVIFAKITPCMENGKGGIARGLKNSIGFGSTEFHVLRPIKEISTSTWLYHLSKQPFFRELAKSKMSGAVGHKRVPKDFFDKYMVVAPPITLQTQFAERIQHIEAQKQQAQAALQKSEDLFNSLLQRAFKGELTQEREVSHA